MIIDCHVHIAPDKIAEAVEYHTQARYGIPLVGSMKVGAVRLSMQANGIGRSVAFNTAQSPELVKTANDYLMRACDNKDIIGFGTIHPGMEKLELEIARLKEKGIKGVKFHPLVQKFAADDERLWPVYKAMGSDMIAYYHCGKDPADLDAPVLNTPEVVARVREAFPKLKIVAAHLGGFAMLDDSRKFILGKDIFIDTAWFPGLEVLDPSAFVQVIRTHGSNRVVFGTDYPITSGVKLQIDYIRNLPLTREDKEKIFWQNAEQLLSI